jgi:hypothetical protein
MRMITVRLVTLRTLAIEHGAGVSHPLGSIPSSLRLVKPTEKSNPGGREDEDEDREDE